MSRMLQRAAACPTMQGLTDSIVLANCMCTIWGLDNGGCQAMTTTGQRLWTASRAFLYAAVKRWAQQLAEGEAR